MIQYFFKRRRNMPNDSTVDELFGYHNLTLSLRETETESNFWWKTCRTKIVKPALQRVVPVTSTRQETLVAEECRTLRNTSSSAASARKSRIGRCAKRKRYGGECVSGKSQVSVSFIRTMFHKITEQRSGKWKHLQNINYVRKN